jgi:hypothetical protein
VGTGRGVDTGSVERREGRREHRTIIVRGLRGAENALRVVAAAATTAAAV